MRKWPGLLFSLWTFATRSRHPWLLAPTICHLLRLSCPGLVNVRKNVGGGSFLAGYKRHFADYSSLEASREGK